MTRAERVLARRWRSALLACVLVALAGAVLLVWARVDGVIAREADGRRAAAAEANLRGTAVSTLVGDVRALRAQLQTYGRTPVAPDPSAAVSNLPARTEVPVPIPGPQGVPGPQGAPGVAGSPGPSGSPGTSGQRGGTGDPGAPGQNGLDGKDGVDGKDGAPGKDGTDGKDGATGPPGPPGPSCPSGYSLQQPPDDPDALECRRDSTPSPSPSTSQPAAIADRRRT